MTAVVSDEQLADCIEVARQEMERFAANAHGRTRIKSDTLDALTELRQLRQQQRAAEWRPIETAPKDGRQVLVAGGTFNKDNSCGGDMDFAGIAMVSWRDHRWEGENSGGHDEYFYYHPAYWRHLPPPPDAAIDAAMAK